MDAHRGRAKRARCKRFLLSSVEALDSNYHELYIILALHRLALTFLCFLLWVDGTDSFSAYFWTDGAI